MQDLRVSPNIRIQIFNIHYNAKDIIGLRYHMHVIYIRVLNSQIERLLIFLEFVKKVRRHTVYSMTHASISA